MIATKIPKVKHTKTRPRFRKYRGRLCSYLVFNVIFLQIFILQKVCEIDYVCVWRAYCYPIYYGGRMCTRYGFTFRMAVLSLDLSEIGSRVYFFFLSNMFCTFNIDIIGTRKDDKQSFAGLIFIKHINNNSTNTEYITILANFWSTAPLPISIFWYVATLNFSNLTR